MLFFRFYGYRIAVEHSVNMMAALLPSVGGSSTNPLEEREVQLYGSNRTCRTAGYLSISLVLGGPAVRQQQNMSDCRPFIDITCPAFLQSNKAQYRTLLTSSLATNVHCISVPSALLPLTLQTDTSYSDRSRQRAGLCFVR